VSGKQQVAVVGATGYAGFELAQLLLRHPAIQKPTFYLRESSAHVECLTEIFPRLRGWAKRRARRFPWTLSLGAERAPCFSRRRTKRRLKWCRNS